MKLSIDEGFDVTLPSAIPFTPSPPGSPVTGPFPNRQPDPRPAETAQLTDLRALHHLTLPNAYQATYTPTGQTALVFRTPHPRHMSTHLGEIAILRRLTHATIVPVLDLFVDPVSHSVVLVTAMVSRFTLRDYLEDDPSSFSELTIRSMAQAMTDAVMYLHFLQLAHNAICPDAVRVIPGPAGPCAPNSGTRESASLWQRMKRLFRRSDRPGRKSLPPICESTVFQLTVTPALRDHTHHLTKLVTAFPSSYLSPDLATELAHGLPRAHDARLSREPVLIVGPARKALLQLYQANDVFALGTLVKHTLLATRICSPTDFDAFSENKASDEVKFLTQFVQNSTMSKGVAKCGPLGLCLLRVCVLPFEEACEFMRIYAVLVNKKIPKTPDEMTALMSGILGEKIDHSSEFAKRRFNLEDRDFEALFSQDSA